ncbi:MAG TPA: hypothetical protein DDX51_02015, partial [Clostridiales bacterium]|nr:hypothetical protein [Clostridiales bacterium]
GSFRSSGSFSGSFRTSGSFRSSGTSRLPEQAACPAESAEDPLFAQHSSDGPYMGSFLWGKDAGGYGLNLI